MDLAKRNTLTWIALTLVLFPVLAVLGAFMRAVQADTLASTQAWFYPTMTLHGVGMVGLWWVAALACASRVLAKYTEPSERIGRFAILGTVAGVALLLASVLIGRFAAGWYFLYPLPLKGTWPTWATVTFLLSLTVLGATWLVWVLDLLRAIAAKYTIGQALGWHYIRGEVTPNVPPAVLISTVSLIAGVACLLSGVVVLVLFYVELLTGATNDALIMKNLTFLFGHLLVNLSLYLALAVVYDVFPIYTSRPWPASKVVAIAWNCVLAIVILAYFHHLYMDFVQPLPFAYLGQIASYASAIPSAVVTLFGAMMIVYRAPVRWNLGFSLLFLGLLGWAIGGVGAVIDSTIAVNTKFHNTLWVPAHFHSYMIEGLVLMVCGYFYHYCQEHGGIPENLPRQRMTIGLLLIGGWGFLAMLYLAGARSVPRRFALYPSELSFGAVYSAIALAFVGVFLAGLVSYIVEIGTRWVRAYRGELEQPRHPVVTEEVVT
ncbi:MAG: cbb3-type cytochrome c oxidase subunit I [Deltaproteobacteria bacterium]|nr:cbb3-type cytochrome c oxidase subunit I [Deltaproteobacteria bacterium]